MISRIENFNNYFHGSCSLIYIAKKAMQAPLRERLEIGKLPVIFPEYLDCVIEVFIE
jgi:hypothetical protein